MAAELILTLHGIGPPHQGVPSGERFYWVTEQAFVSLLQTVAATRQTPAYRLPSRSMMAMKATR